MTTSVIQQLRRTVLLQDGAGLTDGQLLEDWLRCRDEAALAALVRRHSPMVWGVCRRVLSNYHDAEDAFQATFLVLVRKAASIASPGLLANWLYGVAHQTALKARATTAKTRARERQVPLMPEPAVTEHDLCKDLQPLLDQEISRLPDKYRVAIVLCALEGRTRKEAARQLGVPEGTVGVRLARARALLARRLARHGLAVSAAALALAFAQNVAQGGVPCSVVTNTIKAAGLFAAGLADSAGAISLKVAALTEGVLKAMFFAKFKAISLILLAALALGIGVYSRPLPSSAVEGVAATQSGPAQPTGPAAGAPKEKKQTKTVKVEQPKPGFVHGVLDQVDAQVNVITVTLPGVLGIDKNGVVVQGKSLRLENLPVGKNTKITVNGKAGKLAEVNPKMRATLELEVDGGWIQIKSLEAKDAK